MGRRPAAPLLWVGDLLDTLLPSDRRTQSLPRLYPALCERIVEVPMKSRLFRSIEALLQLSQILEKKSMELRECVTVGGEEEK